MLAFEFFLGILANRYLFCDEAHSSLLAELGPDVACQGHDSRLLLPEKS